MGVSERLTEKGIDSLKSLREVLQTQVGHIIADLGRGRFTPEQAEQATGRWRILRSLRHKIDNKITLKRNFEV